MSIYTWHVFCVYSLASAACMLMPGQAHCMHHTACTGLLLRHEQQQHARTQSNRLALASHIKHARSCASSSCCCCCCCAVLCWQGFSGLNKNKGGEAALNKNSMVRHSPAHWSIGQTRVYRDGCCTATLQHVMLVQLACRIATL
jgi:hypothetical protein